LFSSLSAADRSRTGVRKSSETLMSVQIGIVCGVILLLVAICGVFSYQNKMKLKEDEKLEEIYLNNLVFRSEKIIDEELEMDSWEEVNNEEEEEEAVEEEPEREDEDEDEDLSWFDELFEAEERFEEDESSDLSSDSQSITPVSKEHNNYSLDFSCESEPVHSQEYNNNNNVYNEHKNNCSDEDDSLEHSFESSRIQPTSFPCFCSKSIEQNS
jgi:hypothetical protein